MPAPDRILTWAAAVANDWRWLAIAWHVALAALLIAFVTLPRPSRRLLGLVLTVPITSVALVAWASGNPFNSVAFSVLAVLLFRTVVRLPRAPAGGAMAGCRLAGAGLVAFGWAYPHFLRTDTWTAYLYASPFGLLPCPTLSVVIGITLMFGGLSPGWSLLLSAAGGLYGLIGVFVLGVALDAWLFAGAGLLGLTTGVQMFAARVRATDEERLAGSRQAPDRDMGVRAGGAARRCDPADRPLARPSTLPVPRSAGMAVRPGDPGRSLRHATETTPGNRPAGPSLKLQDS